MMYSPINYLLTDTLKSCFVFNQRRCALLQNFEVNDLEAEMSAFLSKKLMLYDAHALVNARHWERSLFWGGKKQVQLLLFSSSRGRAAWVKSYRVAKLSCWREHEKMADVVKAWLLRYCAFWVVTLCSGQLPPKGFVQLPLEHQDKVSATSGNTFYPGHTNTWCIFILLLSHDIKKYARHT